MTEDEALQRITELEAELGRAHELNVEIREVIFRFRREPGMIRAIAAIEKLVKKRQGPFGDQGEVVGVAIFDAWNDRKKFDDETK